LGCGDPSECHDLGCMALGNATDSVGWPLCAYAILFRLSICLVGDGGCSSLYYLFIAIYQSFDGIRLILIPTFWFVCSTTSRFICSFNLGPTAGGLARKLRLPVVWKPTNTLCLHSQYPQVSLEVHLWNRRAMALNGSGPRSKTVWYRWFDDSLL
jgi:hypothetical protein